MGVISDRKECIWVRRLTSPRTGSVLRFDDASNEIWQPTRADPLPLTKHCLGYDAFRFRPPLSALYVDPLDLIIEMAVLDMLTQ